MESNTALKQKQTGVKYFKIDMESNTLKQKQKWSQIFKIDMESNTLKWTWSQIL